MRKAEDVKATVLVVGAGPVGLTLAMDLAWRGVDVVIAEERPEGEPPSVKCNHTSARSMEIFRRLGVAQSLRNAGLPHDHPHDCAYRTSFVGTELCRIEIPSRAGRAATGTGPDIWWPTPEPPHRINQIYLEPVLFQHALYFPNLRILNQVKVESFTQSALGVQTVVRNLQSGEAFKIESKFMVGCDGGRSMIRKGIGAVLQGDAVIQRVQSTYIRAPKLQQMLGQTQPAWLTFALNPRRSGSCYAIDGREKWLIHNYLRDDEADFDSVDRDASIRAILGVGPEFQYEVLSNEDWFGRRLVADKFREGRVFICGDAAHIWVPYAGYGMNAGIADAANLAWMLAAVAQGWAPASMLDAYERERQPITQQVSYFVMDHAVEMAKHRRKVPADIEEAGSHGDAVRAEVGREMYDLNVQQYCCAGLNFGYFYDGSPIIAYDGKAAPAYTMGSFSSSTVPGCRAPHFWRTNGRSVYDDMGKWFTLLRFDALIDVNALVAAAAEKGVPLLVLDIRPEERIWIYQESLVLVRPDLHIAWRADRLPADAAGLVDLIAGRAVSGRSGTDSSGRSVEPERRVVGQ